MLHALLDRISFRWRAITVCKEAVLIRTFCLEKITNQLTKDKTSVHSCTKHHLGDFGALVWRCFEKSKKNTSLQAIMKSLRFKQCKKNWYYRCIDRQWRVCASCMPNWICSNPCDEPKEMVQEQANSGLLDALLYSTKVPAYFKNLTTLSHFTLERPLHLTEGIEKVH